MRSIRDFKPQNDKNTDDVSSRDVADGLYAKYSGYSESELMSELMRAVSSAQSDGSFSPDRLDEFVGFVAPNLD
ncbi:MAG: hypothetical protein OSJ83_14195, partial [Clostridia bacterium]|nr:hypothetical protein [Clostridia bacterium]